ncbi:MAG: YqgE/AlgH family protein [Xanthobacteraceae bacterium]|nr:YqgE/AlgH family protein [Xanthobacteraceae bacterium]
MTLIRAMRLLLLLAALVAPAALFGAAPATVDAPQGQFLTGQLLVATPEMGDPRFRETVILMVRHSKDGAMGLIINRPAGDQKLSQILQDLGDSGEGVTGNLPLYLGGPVQPELGFILHTTDYRRAGIIDVNGTVAVTATREIIRDIAAGNGPKKFMLIFGYAGWGPGQLEGELKRNSWYTTPFDLPLIFDIDRDRVWERAVERRTRDL